MISLINKTIKSEKIESLSYELQAEIKTNHRSHKLLKLNITKDQNKTVK